jgi:hypothetical protein
MVKPKWYSPQLSRELVSRLYQKAKAERLPMTVVANRLMEEALENEKQSNTQRVAENRRETQPE